MVVGVAIRNLHQAGHDRSTNKREAEAGLVNWLKAVKQKPNLARTRAGQRLDRILLFDGHEALPDLRLVAQLVLLRILTGFMLHGPQGRHLRTKRGWFCHKTQMMGQISPWIDCRESKLLALNEPSTADWFEDIGTKVQDCWHQPIFFRSYWHWPKYAQVCVSEDIGTGPSHLVDS